MASRTKGVTASLIFASQSQSEIAKRFGRMKRPVRASHVLLSWTRGLLFLALPGLLAALLVNGFAALRLLMPL